MDDFQSDPLQFASLIAHQLRSPLTSVSQVLQTVLAEYAGPLSGRQRDALEKANARCGEALLAVRRMLAIIQARDAESGAPQSAALMPVIRQAHARHYEEGVRRGIAFGIDSEMDAVHVGLAEPALAEVLAALLNNAMKYTPDQGRVHVAVRPGEKPDTVHIVVEDSGIGVSEEDRARLFEPFFRGHRARGSGRPGVGLGLAFVKSIVTGAGGAVSVGRSDLGGAAFLVELPRVEAAAAEPEGGRAPAFRVVVIGGSVAGPKAAAKIMRLRPDADLTIVDAGTVLTHAGCGLPYYVAGGTGFRKQLFSELARGARQSIFSSRLPNVHVINHTEAVEIDRAGKRVRLRDALTQRDTWMPYDKLLLATGSSAAVPEHLGAALDNVFTLHGGHDAEGIKTAMAETRARDVVIVGGGLLGIEMTEALALKGARVTVVEKRAHILPRVDDDIAMLVERHLEAHGVRVLTGTRAMALAGDGRVSGVETDRGPCRADVVILAIGVHPNTELAAAAGLRLGVTGAVAVDAGMRTSDPDIYAAGDCAESVHLLTGEPCYIPMGSTANKQGRTAAVNLCGGDDTFPGVLGSMICKVFGYCIARTGLGEKDAAALGYDAVPVRVSGPDRESFMPDARLILLKLIVDRRTRRLLGAQATGPGAGDKRIDLAALCIGQGMTVDQVANADLCYAPAFSPAMDNLITAANVARNKLAGDFTGVGPLEVRAMQEDGRPFVFLDVRTLEEHDAVRLAGARLVPLGALRERVGELPRDGEIVTFSSLSLRAYEAARILRAAGCERVRVMEGGVAMWPYETVD